MNDIPAQKDNNRISFSRDEAQEKNISAATVVAFKLGFTEWSIFVKRYFLVFCTYKMVDDMAKKKNKYSNNNVHSAFILK